MISSGDKTTINRTNYDSFWLEKIEPPNTSTKFNSFILKEKPLSRELVKNSIVEAIIFHHVPDMTFSEIEKSLRDLEFEEVFEQVSHHLPKKDKNKKGNFGEVISAEHLCQKYGYEMPVFKLKYSTNPDMPMHGEDVISFEIEDNSINTICICEVKTLSDYNSGKVRKAHAQLKDIENVSPLALSLIQQVLSDRNDYVLFKQVKELSAKLGLKDFPRHNWIFILTGDLHHDPFATLERLEDGIDDLTVVNIHLPMISDFVNEIFRMCGVNE